MNFGGLLCRLQGRHFLKTIEEYHRDNIEAARRAATEGHNRAFAALQMVEQDLKIVSEEEAATTKVSEAKNANFSREPSKFFRGEP